MLHNHTRPTYPHAMPCCRCCPIATAPSPVCSRQSRLPALPQCPPRPAHTGPPPAAGSPLMHAHARPCPRVPLLPCLLVLPCFLACDSSFLRACPSSLVMPNRTAPYGTMPCALRAASTPGTIADVESALVRQVARPVRTYVVRLRVRSTPCRRPGGGGGGGGGWPHPMPSSPMPCHARCPAMPCHAMPCPYHTSHASPRRE